MKYNTKIPTGKIDIHISTLEILDRMSKATKISKNIIFEMSLQHLLSKKQNIQKVQKRKNFLINCYVWFEFENFKDQMKFSKKSLIEIAINDFARKEEAEIIELAQQYKQNRKRSK